MLQESDGCYGWWVGATLAILQKQDLLDSGALCRFIVGLQRPQGGLGAHPDSSPVCVQWHGFGWNRVRLQRQPPSFFFLRCSPAATTCDRICFTLTLALRPLAFWEAPSLRRSIRSFAFPCPASKLCSCPCRDKTSAICAQCFLFYAASLGHNMAVNTLDGFPAYQWLACGGQQTGVASRQGWPLFEWVSGIL